MEAIIVYYAYTKGRFAGFDCKLSSTPIEAVSSMYGSITSSGSTTVKVDKIAIEATLRKVVAHQKDAFSHIQGYETMPHEVAVFTEGINISFKDYVKEELRGTMDIDGKFMDGHLFDCGLAFACSKDGELGECLLPSLGAKQFANEPGVVF